MNERMRHVTQKALFGVSRETRDMSRKKPGCLAKSIVLPSQKSAAITMEFYG